VVCFSPICFRYSRKSILFKKNTYLLIDLQVNTAIEILNLSDCKMSASSLIAVAIAMESNMTLTHLDISNNESNTSRLSQTLTNDVIIHIARMMRTTTMLQNLNLSKMGITDWACVNLIAPAIMATKTITSLNLSWWVKRIKCSIQRLNR
jgi:hypothetical protein